MNSNQDPRIQIYANLDDVQNDIEKAAKERKEEIQSQAKDDMKDIKDEMKDLKQGVKDDLEHYKKEMKDSDDPYAKEKINIAKETHKMMEKDIEADYENTKERIENDRDMRINSIENVLDDENDRYPENQDLY